MAHYVEHGLLDQGLGSPHRALRGLDAVRAATYRRDVLADGRVPNPNTDSNINSNTMTLMTPHNSSLYSKPLTLTHATLELYLNSCSTSTVLVVNLCRNSVILL